jgi:hypothetical protein
MRLISRIAGALALALLPGVAFAQVAPSTPVRAPAGFIPAEATFCSSDNGTTWGPCSGSGGGGGTDPRVAQGSTTAGQTGSLTQGAVVTGDQAYTAGTTQPLTLTPTGRLKVGLSSATNIAPAAQPSTTLTSDLFGCVYRTPTAWTVGWSGAAQCDAAGNLTVNVAAGSVGLSAGSNAIGSITNTGFAVTSALPAGTNIIGQVSVNQATPGTTNGFTMLPNAAASLGIAPATVASVSSQVAKASAGNLYGLNVDNAAVTGTYALIYNATAAPSAGATLTASLILWHFTLGSAASLDKAFTIPVRCSVGCVVLYSTSLTTFTAPATAPALSTVMVL